MQKLIQLTHSVAVENSGGVHRPGTSYSCNLLYNIYMKNQHKQRQCEGVRGRAISQKNSSCFHALSHLCNLSGVCTYLCMYTDIPRWSL